MVDIYNYQSIHIISPIIIYRNLINSPIYPINYNITYHNIYITYNKLHYKI